jgi:hypothetical protein
MTNSDDLVRRLEEEARAHDRKTGWPEMTKIEAANRIRELEAERNALWSALGMVDTTDPHLANHVCEKNGLDLGRAMVKAAQEQDND